MDLFSKKNNETNESVEKKDKKLDKSTRKDKKSNKAKYLTPKDMNFFERYQTIVEGKQEKIDPKFFIYPAAGVLGVLLVIVLGINLLTLFKENSNKKIQEYISDANNVATYNEALDLSESISKLNASKTALDQAIAIMDKYPSIDKNLKDVLIKNLSGEIKINGVNYESAQGSIMISCVSSSVNAIPVYVQALIDSGEFHHVSYTGYSLSSGGYSFTVACLCKSNG